MVNALMNCHTNRRRSSASAANTSNDEVDGGEPEFDSKSPALI